MSDFLPISKEDMEKRIYEWNKKNEVPLREGYLQTQLLWAYRKKPIMPPNCKEFYQGFGACQPNEFCNLIKNPVNYLVRKNYISNNKKEKKVTKKINKNN